MSISLLGQPPKTKDFGIKSKKSLAFYLEGRQQAQWRSWEKAAEMHELAIELEPDFAEAHFYAGVAYVIRLKFKEALPHLEKAATLKPDHFGGIGFYLGQAYFFNEQYEESIPYYAAYLQEGRGGPTYEKTVTLNLTKAQFARDAIKNPVSFEPINLGSSVNSDADDYLPCLTADEQTLLLVSRRSESGYDPLHREYTEDFYFCTKEGDGWKKAKNLGPTINTNFNEGAACLTQDGKTLFFTGCNRPEGLGSCDIYVSRWNEKDWTAPENLGPSLNSEYFDGQPNLSQDGKRLYFTSNRKGGKGGDDIWFSDWDNGIWTTPKNLPGPINTEGNENQPFLHADDQTFYFSSDYHPGFGDADLFVSYRDENREWGTPKNLGYPINTASQEANITINTLGTTGYFNSFREGGLGKSDLYSFNLDESIRPRRATFLRGLTRDSIT
ncbi:hypothetical protein N9933_03100, partial [bacterium]|nr:hypothetical protein [bacterium]